MSISSTEQRDDRVKWWTP